MKKEEKRKRGLSRKVTVKIELERIDTQEGITVKTLLDSRVTGLVIVIRRESVDRLKDR